MNRFINPRNLLIVGIIILAALIRFLPLPPNVTPILAMALMGGFLIDNRKIALLIPMLVMLLSDIFLGFHEGMPGVYLSFAIIVIIGALQNQKKGSARILVSSVISSLVFFILSNLSIWLFSSWYPFTFAGLVECFDMAIPFFRNTLFSTVGFALVFFGIYTLANKYVPSMRLQSEKV